MKTQPTVAQRWADAVTEFSGSWPFIIWFTVGGIFWVILNVSHLWVFDPYPFLFLNWILTVVSTMQSPLIMMSQNRQNDRDREHMQTLLEKMEEILKRME